DFYAFTRHLYTRKLRKVMMDKKPDRECKIEYVDAEPIEGSGAPAPEGEPFAGRSPGMQGQPHVYTYYQRSQGCGPCCGPIGCGVMIAAVLLVLGQPQLLRPLLLAMAIIVGLSLLS